VVFSIGNVEARCRRSAEAVAGEMINTRVRLLEEFSAREN
jgi:hypothetical protein